MVLSFLDSHFRGNDMDKTCSTLQGIIKLNMNRINKKFLQLKKENKKAFIPYIVSGDPSIYITYELLLEFDKIGVDIVELGVPFSDPLADGPTIQRAYQRSLKRGTNLDSI